MTIPNTPKFGNLRRVMTRAGILKKRKNSTKTRKVEPRHLRALQISAESSSEYSHAQSHCGVEALEILSRLLEGVQGRRLQFAARRLPFLVVLLAVLCPRARAC